MASKPINVKKLSTPELQRNIYFVVIIFNTIQEYHQPLSLSHVSGEM